MIYFTEQYLKEIIAQKKVEETNTPSMDIQIASNFERLLYDVKEKNSEVTKDIMKKLKIIRL